MIERAIALAETIPDDRVRKRILAGIAEQTAVTNPGDAELIERAIALADAIPDNEVRGEALARIAGIGGGAALWVRAAQWRSAPLSSVVRTAHALVGALDLTSHRNVAFAVTGGLLRAVREFAPPTRSPAQ